MQGSHAHVQGIAAQSAVSQLATAANQAPLTWNPVLSLQAASLSNSSAPSLGKRPRDDSPVRDTTKRPRYFEQDCLELDSDEQEDDGPGLAEPFDPDSFYEKASKELPEPLEKYTQKFFRSCIKDSLRKSMSKEHPLPESTALRCLQADDSVKDFMGNSFPKKFDDIYKRIQSSVNAAAAPALNLWRDLHNQGFLGGQDNLMPVDTCLGMIQRTLVLVGNASNYVSQCRRDNIIFKLKRQNPTLGTALGSICQEHQPGTKYLFGGEVHKALNERAECLSSMKKVSSKLEKPRTSGGHRDSQFFRQGPSSDRGRGSGRVFRPHNKRQFKRREGYKKSFNPNPNPNPNPFKKQQ